MTVRRDHVPHDHVGSRRELTGYNAGYRLTVLGWNGGNDFNLSCADYADSAADPAHSASISAGIYAYDPFLNSPAAGATVSVQPTGPATSVALTPTGFANPTRDTWGAMGVFGQDFDYALVSAKTDASGNNLPCVIANGQACVDKLFFGDFGSGLAGKLQADNSAITPPAAAARGKSTTGFGCAPTADQYGSARFTAQVSVKQVNNVTATTPFTGLFAPGK